MDPNANQEPATVVVFRAYRDGDVIALMPELPVDSRGHVNSYMHVGQHGAASYSGVVYMTRAATPEEYAPLLRELQQIGYNVDVRQRRPRGTRGNTYGR